MKVHFNGPLDGNKEVYARIDKKIEALGYSLVTRHAIERDIKDVETETEAESELAAKKISSWIKKADIVVFEASRPDVSLGFEIASALNMSKPVIVLYHKSGQVPHGLKGIHNDKLQLICYDDQTLEEMLEYSLEYAEESSDIRFNFFIPPRIVQYLDYIAREKKIPRSVYLRTLIEEDMEKNAVQENELN